MAEKIDLSPVLNDTSVYLINYVNYVKSETTIKYDTYTFKKRIKTINTFLNAYAKSLGLHSSKFLTEKELEELPVDFVQEYLFDKDYKEKSLSTKDYILYANWSFWNYLTIETYSKATGSPLFYRNAFNEWKVAYKDYYDSIRNKENPKKIVIFSKQRMLEILNYLEHNYILSLTSMKQIENWKVDEERNIAILALFFATGVSLEEIYYLNLRDINLKEKWLKVRSNEETRTVTIDDDFIPYLSPYVKKRREWWSADKNQPSLFLTRTKKRPSSSMYASVLLKLSQGYGEKLNPYDLRISHGVNLLKETGNIDELRAQHGIKTMAGVKKYLDNQLS